MKKQNKGKAAEGDRLPENAPSSKKQLFPKRAGKYLREGGKIEDYPDNNGKTKKN